MGTTDQSQLERQRVWQRAHGRAQSRARQRLIRAHREEFKQYLEAEKAAEGIRTLQSRQVAS